MNQTQTPASKRILIVDDDRSGREVLRDLLSCDNHTVIEANNGAEAFGLFCQQPFDLVVTDCRMPFVHGNELAARIRRMAPEQPIIMITGYRNRPGQNNPVDVVLEKPFDAASLRRLVAEALESTACEPQGTI